jgi:hypothetical protein
LNAVILVAACKFNYTSGIVCNGLKRYLVAVMAPVDYFRIGLQPGFLVQKCERSRHKKLGLEMESEIREKGWKWKKKIPLGSYKNPPSPLVKGESHPRILQLLIKNFKLEFIKYV